MKRIEHNCFWIRGNVIQKNERIKTSLWILRRNLLWELSGKREDEARSCEISVSLSDFRFLSKKHALKDNSLSKTGNFLSFSMPLKKMRAKKSGEKGRRIIKLWDESWFSVIMRGRVVVLVRMSRKQFERHSDISNRL